MGINKPFHRNYRKIKSSSNSGYSDWAYIIDKEYAKNPEHYLRAFSIIQSDVIKLFEYIEPSDINLTTYSFRIHELLMRICIEVEANFKAILKENIFAPLNRDGQLRLEKYWNINDFRKINVTHHLDNYTVEFPFWKGEHRFFKPYQNWSNASSPIWYQAYNQSKHDRLNNFQDANFGNLLNAFAGLFVLLSSQFRTESFSTGQVGRSISGNSYFSGEFGIGDFLMIEFPNNWEDSEMYDFDWSLLKNESVKFEKFNYNNL